MTEAEAEERRRIAMVLSAVIAVAAVELRREERQAEQARVRQLRAPQVTTRINNDWLRRAS